jgi:hypothetical protein
MSPRKCAAAGVLVLVLLAAQDGCGSGANGPLAGEVGVYDDGGPSFVGSDAAAGALDAHIEQNHITVAFVTLSCAGPCADVVAVPTGGQAPYTFKWEDGSMSASRHVCPTSSTSYQVTVTDTGTVGELARPAETAQTSLTADVIACPEGGTSDAGAGLCISNPSFEGTAGVFDATPWNDCEFGLSPGVWNQLWNASTRLPGQQGPSLSPTDGQTYLEIGSCTQGGASCVPMGGGLVSGMTCAPLHTGTSYSLKIDLASTLPGQASALDTPIALQIWGASSSCSKEEPLWTSPILGPSWKTYCATFVPARDETYLALGVVAGVGAAFVDHIVPVASCP